MNNPMSVEIDVPVNRFCSSTARSMSIASTGRWGGAWMGGSGTESRQNFSNDVSLLDMIYVECYELMIHSN